MFSTSIKSLTLALVPVVGLLASPALAVTGPGAVMKNSFPADNSCLSTLSYGGIINNCTHSVAVVGTLQLPAGYHATSISIYGDNSWCQTVSVNGVGNGAYFPNNNQSPVYTTAGPKTWQVLNLGNLYVANSTGTIFRCQLEAGGAIGNFTAQ